MAKLNFPRLDLKYNQHKINLSVNIIIIVNVYRLFHNSVSNDDEAFHSTMSWDAFFDFLYFVSHLGMTFDYVINTYDTLLIPISNHMPPFYLYPKENNS